MQVPTGGGAAGEGSEEAAKADEEDCPEQCFRGKAGTIAGLLRDAALMTNNRFWGRTGAARRVIYDVIAILQVLALEDLDEEDYNPYDGTPRPLGHLDPFVGAKGVDLQGRCQCPWTSGKSTP